MKKILLTKFIFDQIMRIINQLANDEYLLSDQARDILKYFEHHVPIPKEIITHAEWISIKDRLPND